uniref:BHLH domain-containing protein n=1 Tax=Oreochromis niloticus TaxID=8128 RepID=A0A669CQ19_ORENI
MAPKVTAAMTNTQEHLTLTHKLRKPLVEKLQFLKQQPDSKLEKADILEVTVCFLTQLQQQNQQQRNLLNSFSKLQTASDEKLREDDLFPLTSTVQTSIMKDNSALWRPW